MIFAAIGIWKMRKKEKEERKEAQTKQRTKNEKPMRSSFLHASAILFSSVLVHLCVVNSTVNEWSGSSVVCATSCEVTQTGKFCKHTRMLCKHFFAWVRAKSRGFAPVSCVYCKPALRGKWRPRTPRWYNAALTHTKWMGNPSSPTLSSNCENRRACFCQTSPGMHVWGVLVPIRTVFVRSNRPRG